MTPLSPDERFFAPAQEFIDVQFADRALHALEELAAARRNSQENGTDPRLLQPFFIGVGFSRPHEPLVFPKEFHDLYAANDPQDLDYGGTATPGNSDSFSPPPCPLSPQLAPPFARGDVQSPYRKRFQGSFGSTYYCRGSEDSECSVPKLDKSLNRFYGMKRPLLDDPIDAWPMPARDALPAPYRNELLRGYLGAASFMDNQLGRLLEALTNLNLESSTVVIFHSDHGFSIGDHGQWGKRSLYEHDARVPLIISDPTRPEGHGSRSQALVELVDVLPTLAELTGININNHHSGHHHGREGPSPEQTKVSAVFSGPPLSGTTLADELNGESRGVRIGAVTQFARCIASGNFNSAGTDFRRGNGNGISWGCTGGRGHEWYRKFEAVVMGYSLRIKGWRYTAWLLWAPNEAKPVWR